MRTFGPVRYGVLAALLGACPGTIDDPSVYQGGSYAASTSRDAAAGVEQEEGEPAQEEEADSTSAPRDASVRDAGAADGASAGWLMDGAVSDASERWQPEAALVDASPANNDGASALPEAGGATPDTGAACDFRALMAAKCGNAGCHGAPAASSGLDLTSANLAARVANQMATGACGSYLLIDRAQPERSALYLKVTADSCGTRMPLGGTLTDREQMCVLQWIQNL